MTQHKKRILVTGGSSDIALSLIPLLIKEKLFPLVTYSNEKSKEILTEHLYSHQSSYSLCYLDFSKSDTIANLAPEFRVGIDYMIDIAHSNFESYISTIPDNEIYNYYETNLAGRTLLIKYVSRSMLEKRKGRFLFISSTATVQSNPGQGLYASTKSACEALYRNVGIELAHKGITCVTLRLGYVDAGRGKSYLANNISVIKDKIPSGRLISKEEVNNTVLYLLSDNAQMFNAVELTMDGGLCASK